ncbi:MAG: ribosomal protein S18-alanine N-acetyltransferase [Thiobacillaceae bacterium]|jgi:ribosomal-protein-alanine N-acetyltransferase|nr:ribosomal protein S18-alanine N-acetyltransferase [Thiobacillaceae bacterium]
MSAILRPALPDFRPMANRDLEHIVRIERAAYPYPWSLGNFRDCLHAGYSCWVAELERELIGYFVLLSAAGEGHILNCCVSPPWQGRGYGRLLMEQLMDTARGHGVEFLFLEVRPSNAPAIRLYESLGFEGIALRRGYYPADQGREDALVMRLGL